MTKQELFNFQARCSNLTPLFAGGTNGGRTAGEESKMKDLLEKHNRVLKTDTKERWTDKNQEDLNSLVVAAARKPSLGAGALTLAETHFKEWYYGRKKMSVDTDATVKGTRQEDDSIEVVSRVIDDPFLTKYTGPRLTNGFICGTPDVIAPNQIIEIKSPETCWTQPLIDIECPKKDYLYQVQGYMELADKPKATICYVLVDMPESIIEKYIYYATKDVEDLDAEKYDEIAAKVREYHTYSNLPDWKREKSFEIERDPDFAELAKQKVLLVREEVKRLYELHVVGAQKVVQ